MQQKDIQSIVTKHYSGLSSSSIKTEKLKECFLVQVSSIKTFSDMSQQDGYGFCPLCLIPG